MHRILGAGSLILYMVGASPYVRKVRAAAVQLGVDSQIDLVISNPHVRPAELLAVNPLSRVPVLVDEDGIAHVDSYAICDFLDGLSDAAELIPKDSGRRSQVLRRHALADGIMGCSVIRRVEEQMAQEPDRVAWISRQKKTIERVLDWFEADQDLEGDATLDRLTLGAALGFLDFRFPADDWRTGRPRLTDWFAEFDKTPPMTLTRPFD